MSNKVKLSSRCTVLFLVMLAIVLGNLSRRHAAANASAQPTPTPPSNAPVPALVIVAGSHDHSATTGDDVPATSARIEPTSVTADGGGNLFIAESSANRVRRVAAATNVITTIAGGGDDALGDGGPATNTRLAAPSGVAVDRGGNLYIAEQGAHRIRRVTPEGIITTIAGTGASGFLGDGGPARSAHLTRPKLVALDRADGLYIVEADGRRVRKVALGSGIITTVAGNGASGFGGDGGPAVAAQFGNIFGLALDEENNLYLSDFVNHSVRKVAASTGVITRVAGLANGQLGFANENVPALEAGLREPQGVAIDRAGDLYIAERAYGRVRKVSRATGLISTVAGGGSSDYARLGQPPLLARFDNVQAVTFDAAGHLLIVAGIRVWKILPFTVVDDHPLRVAITAPIQSGVYTTDNPSLEMRGTVSLQATVTELSCNNERGFSTTQPRIAFDRGEWSCRMPLAVGPNRITITVRDLHGASASASITAVYNAAEIGHTLAGNRTPGFGGDGGPGFAARLSAPEAVALDAQGNLYIADAGNHRVRRVTPQGLITTFAGNGVPGYSGDGGPATAASLTIPRGVAVDVAGNVYIADAGQHRVRKVALDGTISTIAGTGVAGFSGDGAAATSAQLNAPHGLAVDTAGNVYIADRGNHRVRKIAVGTGIISSIVGGGMGFSGDGGPAATAQLNGPRGLAVDAAGNLYIADAENRRVRKVSTTGTISTVAGNGQLGVITSGTLPAAGAPLITPTGVAVDREGNLYISHFGISKVGTDGMLQHIAGDNVVGAFRDEGGGPPLTFLLGSAAGVAVDAPGNLYVADRSNHRVVLLTKYRNVVSVLAASFTDAALASEAIVAAFGTNLAMTTVAAMELPLPLTLAGASVRVRDSAGVERFAPLFFVSPTQINYQIPPGTAVGPATIVITDGRGAISSGNALIAATAPGLFSADATGRGVAAGVALRIKADGAQSYEPLAIFDSAQNKLIARPLDPGAPADQLFLILFGTGWRGRSSVSATLGGERVDVLYAGAQGALVGLDQLNLPLPRSLSGRGEIDVVVTVDGKPANTLRVAMAGSLCAYQVAPANHSVPAVGGTISLDVATSAECSWSARPNADWLTPAFSGYRLGSGAVSFNVAANTDPLPRRAEIQIAGQNIIVAQSGAGDVPPPSLTINSPANNGSLTTGSPTINLRGTAAANAGVALVTWSNDRGGGGFAAGTTEWSVANVPLQSGVNILTVTAYDNVGRRTSAQLRVNFQAEFIISTCAGGAHGDSGDGGPATAAGLSYVRSIAFDAAGNLYIATERRIRKVNTDGIISTVAGNGEMGHGPENVLATATPLNRVGGLVFDGAGNLYFAEIESNRIRKIDAATGLVTTVAGLRTSERGGFEGDGGPATEARLNLPHDIAFDAAGNLYIADTLNHRVRRVEAATGIINTIAGNGNAQGPLGDDGPAAAAMVCLPESLAFNAAGELFIGSSSTAVNNSLGRVRRVHLATGIITTFAGGGAVAPGNGVPATAAALDPHGLAFDRADNLYLADDQYWVWRVASGLVMTIAGTGNNSSSGDGGPAVSAAVASPVDIAFDKAGNVYVAEGNSSSGRIRKLTPLAAGATYQLH